MDDKEYQNYKEREIERCKLAKEWFDSLSIEEQKMVATIKYNPNFTYKLE